MSDISFVVPANAGTHNHRPWFCERTSTTLLYR